MVGVVELSGLDKPFGDAMLDLGVVLDVFASGRLEGEVAIVSESIVLTVLWKVTIR